MLKNNKNIIFINLNNNQIQIEGIKAIVSALTINKTLTGICLSDNCYYEEGGKLIIPMLKKNYTLLNITFDGDEDYITFVYNCIERNEKLQWKNIHSIIMNICIALWSSGLPNYVLLEIIDWFPFWEVALNRYKKVILIENVNRSICKMLEKREINTIKEIKNQ